MGKELINKQYIKQLQSLASEQNESALVSDLVNNVKVEYSHFLEAEKYFCGTQEDLQGRNDILFKVHRLKNCFSNVGAERASGLLDELYHEVECGPDPQTRVIGIWEQFKEVADLTFDEIEKVIN